MDKAKLHHYWVRTRTASLIVTLSLTIIFGILAIVGLRTNNLTMLKLKQAVIVADQEDGDIETALQNLRDHVTNHMNTDLRPDGNTEPPIQLVNEFNRYVQKEQQRLEAEGNTANTIYKEAQDKCETGAIPLTARAQCIQEYIVAKGSAGSTIQLPPKELYTFDFVSPKWSPDLAGISIVLFFLSLGLLIGRIVLGRLINRQLK